MPSVPASSVGPMSAMTWRTAMGRVAGAIAGARLPDSLAAAKDAISETLEDWDTRRDWRFTQVVAADISLLAGAVDFDLPTNFKKPYVAYLSGSRQLLQYLERANWHRAFPGDTNTGVPNWYTLFNEASTGKGQLFMPTSAADTLVVLYYRSILTDGDEDDLLDIPKRWQGYILRGAKALVTTGRSAGKKSDDWWTLYEKGIESARKDDLRIPDQFLTFMPPGAMPPDLRPNQSPEFQSWSW